MGKLGITERAYASMPPAVAPAIRECSGFSFLGAIAVGVGGTIDLDLAADATSLGNCRSDLLLTSYAATDI